MKTKACYETHKNCNGSDCLHGSWKIEYEIPPLRAIYFAAIDDCSEATAREVVAKDQPLLRIRKITPIEPQSTSATNPNNANG